MFNTVLIANHGTEQRPAAACPRTRLRAAPGDFTVR
jgi:hypothetical protein